MITVESAFGWCVQVLQSLAAGLGTSYEAVNVWLFLVIVPVVFLLLLLVIGLLMLKRAGDYRTLLRVERQLQASEAAGAWQFERLVEAKRVAGVAVAAMVKTHIDEGVPFRERLHVHVGISQDDINNIGKREITRMLLRVVMGAAKRTKENDLE